MQATDSIYCDATLNYSKGEDRQPLDVTIHDGRAALGQLDFETCGFAFMEHRSKVRDWRDQAELEAVHVPEIHDLVQQFMGCDHAIVYSPLIRSPDSASRTPDFAPIDFVHSDFTEDYGDMVREAGRPYHEFLDPLLAEQGLRPADVAAASRVALIQFWRNTGDVQPDYPLAICDGSTVPRSQLRTFLVPEYGGERLEFETFGVVPPADDHTWYTFPRMSTDEVLVFRTYDSRCQEEGRAFWTPHTAFRDPVAGDAAPPRESVEMRALCLFGTA